MRIRRSTGFWQEVERFDFRFCCDDCSYYRPDRQCCAHGWPVDEHRRAHYDHEPPPETIVFCKEFELR